MLEFIVGLFSGLIDLLNTFLPHSPLQGISLPEGVGQALGWLNWIIPVQGALVSMTVWLGALLAYKVVKFILSKIDVISIVTGGGK